MTLMERINVSPFHDLGLFQQYDLIESVRKKRVSAIEYARTTKGKGRTKSATKNIAKRKNKKATKDPEKKAAEALAKLTPEQLEKISKLM